MAENTTTTNKAAEKATAVKTTSSAPVKAEKSDAKAKAAERLAEKSERAAEKASKKEKPARRRKQKGLLCDELSFAAAESYKLLRTNLLFALPDQECRIIGVTSSIRGEGKSTTSVNLAYTLAQTGKKVLLIDGDMRLPTIAQKLDLAATPGLSNLLAGLNAERDCLRKSSYFDNWYILPAGDIPPNPSELLGSERMHALLDRYKDVFDYILLDLPPVNIVVDALVITKWTDGIMVVVRENYSNRRALDACMYQVEKLGAKMLGFVMTDANVSASSYKHYSKYGKYGKYGKYKSYGSYDYGYGYGYDKGGRKSTKKKDQAFLDAAGDDDTAFGDDHP